MEYEAEQRQMTKKEKKNDYFDDADATTAATLADDVHV